MQILSSELIDAEDEVERLGVLAAIEDEAEYENLSASLGVDRVLMLEQLLAESEQDRAARLHNMNQLEKLLAESEKDRAARLDNIHELEQLCSALELVNARQALELVVLRAIRYVRRKAAQAARVPYRIGRRMYRVLSRDGGST